MNPDAKHWDTRTQGHITLSGPNEVRITRIVYLDAIEIGKVIPGAPGLWIACDLAGQCHGDTWLTDWYAADALSRSPRLGGAK